ncbi:MAG: asparagine synthase (glutamine-hydrolyzing) [Bacteroidota bacterium]|nr:asparagine synthase (glutamine-hydrolyzing) [Bacteroidota bacterium]
MCGIAGIFAYHYASPDVDRDELRRMRDRMRRRGPDGEGEWYSSDGRVGLAHRRLAIIDLSGRAAQPMVSAEGRTLIVYNGEIYNYRELRKKLEAKGFLFKTESDTEVLLSLWEDKGERMFEDLRGMYAFMIWDDLRGELILARDPYGIKPLYYADDGWCFRAASQVKALLAGGKISRAAEPAGIVGFFLMGSVPEPFTTYAAIRELPAGSWMRVTKTGASEPVRYHSIAAVWAEARRRLRPQTEEDAHARVREALAASVRYHMVADVPVGAFLSAGIDSSALVGLMRDAGVEDIRTMTLGFTEYGGKHDDETPLAAETAERYRTRHTMRLLGAEEFRRDLEDIFDLMDQPSIDGVNTYFVSKVAAECGLKVALSGLGGDELFGGYNSFDDIPRWVHAFAVPSRIPFLGTVVRRAYGLLGGAGKRSPKAAGAIEFGGTYPGAYYLRRGLFLPWELEEFLDPEMVRSGWERLSLLTLLRSAMEPDPGTPFGRVAALEAGVYMRNQLLRDTDWAGMAHSVELRVPFVDAMLLYDLAPVLLAYGPRLRKKLLALSPSSPLPEKLSNRQKTGFQVPVREWLEGGAADDAWREIPSLRREGCPWARRWAYCVSRRFGLV